MLGFVSSARAKISINVKQFVAIVWTAVAFAISLIIALASGISPLADWMLLASWQWPLALFFGLFLVITAPVYLLIALWHIVSQSGST